jgi:TPR repeat protein
LAATPAAWSQSASGAGGASQPAQTNSGSGDNVLTIDSSELFPFDDPAADATACDNAAANPTDPKRPSAAAGIAFDKIDTKNAIAACRVAVKTNPNVPRLEYELGRALDADKQYDEAMSYYHKAADAGYAAAMVSIGLTYEEGIGVTKDLSLAKEWYQKAIDAGDAHAKGNLSNVEQASLLGRLSGTWFDMGDEYGGQMRCAITFAEDGSIGYRNCSVWNFVGITPHGRVLFNSAGSRCFVDSIAFAGDRVNISTIGEHCDNFTLERDSP